MAHYGDERANPFDTGFVVDLAEIYRAAHLGMHSRAAQLFGRYPLSNRRLHQRGPGQKQARTFGHQDVIAHHRQIGAARHAHPHDGRDLRDTHRAHHGIVAEDAPEIIGVGEDVFLQRQKYAGRIHQVDRRDMIVDGDILCANHFFGG